MKTSGRILIGLTGIGLLALASTRVIDAQTSGEPLRMTAFAISMSNVATGANATVDINITRWSTDEEQSAHPRPSSRRAPQAASLLQKQKDCGHPRAGIWVTIPTTSVRLAAALRAGADR